MSLFDVLTAAHHVIVDHMFVVMEDIDVMEDELVVVLEKLVASGLVIGTEVGVISYNETPVKKFILNGITTISTDFHQMGIAAAQLNLSNSKEHEEIPFKLTLRASL